MEKTHKIFDNVYTTGSETSTGTISEVHPLTPPSPQTYSKDTKVILLSTTDEEGLLFTTSGSPIQQKWGMGKPYRIIIRGKVSQ